MQQILQHPFIAVVFLIGILVFVHEFGHFIVGKLFGFGVEIFSIGFGPRAFGFRKNGTDYRVSFIPLGGYVKFAGNMPSEPVEDRFRGQEIYKKPVWQRALMTFAGPFANLLLAVCAYTYLGSTGISHEAPIVGQVRPGGPADLAGLQPGDKIVGVFDAPVLRWNELVAQISEAGGKSIALKVERSDQEIEKTVVPEFEEVEGITGEKKKVGRIGISHGFLPSKVSVVLGSESDALGFENGDQILSLASGVEQVEIKTFYEFQTQLGKLYLSGVSQVSIGVKPSLFSGKNAGSTKALQFSFGQYELPDQTRLSGYQTGKFITTALGLRDSSLTISAPDTDDSPLKSGDIVTVIEGNEIKNIFDLQYFLTNNKNSQVSGEVTRQGKKLDFSLDLKPVEVQKAKGKDVFYAFPAKFMGERIRPEPYIEKYSGLLPALGFGIVYSLEQSAQILGALVGLITGDVPLGALGGPMLIAKVAGDSAALGLSAYLTVLALISINLCMINLFPIPVLDGGQLVMLGAEAIKGKSLSEAAIENYQKIGFVMVMGLIFLSTYNDLGRFWGSMLRTVGGAP